MAKFTTIKIGNTSNAGRAEKLKEALHGKTYMNFKVLICPAGGSFDIFAETDYEESEAEITSFLLEFLAARIMAA